MDVCYYLGKLALNGVPEMSAEQHPKQLIATGPSVLAGMEDNLIQSVCGAAATKVMANAHCIRFLIARALGHLILPLSDFRFPKAWYGIPSLQVLSILNFPL